MYTFPDSTQGIVYYLLPDGSGGWVVALNDLPSSCYWGQSVSYPAFIAMNPLAQNHRTDTAGYKNTQFLRQCNFQGHDFGANLVDFEHGWYIPAAAQLSRLYSQLPYIESALSSHGNTLLNKSYWSSTAKTSDEAYFLYFGSDDAAATGVYSGSFGNHLTCCYYGIETIYFRAVRNFTFPFALIDTSLTYQWNTGSSQSYINPTPQQTTIYTVTATNESGCSATATQTIFVAESPQQDFYDEICQGEPYEANGFTVSASETATPGTLTRTRTVIADGCSSIVTLHLTVLPTAFTEISQEACQTYVWNGVTIYESGNYEQHFLSANGCDSTVVLHLTLHSPDTTYLTESACDSYALNGTIYSYSGTYIQHLTNGNGCDSLVMLNLTIHPTHYIAIDTTVYDGMDFGGVHYSESGTYTLEYQSQYGCDSVIQLNLNVLHLDTVSVDSTVCGNALPLVWNGVNFFASGSQTVTLPSFQGYDSVVVMTLHVNPTVASTSSATACDSYVWAGETYTQSGTYIRIFTDQNGCDSIVTLTLTVNHTVTELIEATVCDSYEWAGETYTQSGTYIRVFTNQQGCDSVVTLTLTVNPSETGSFDTTVCEMFLWNGQTYTQTGEYVQTLSNRFGCDSVVTANVTVNYEDSEQVDTIVCPQSLPVTVRGLTFSGAGTQSITLPNIHGCDSTTIVHVAVSDTSTVVTNHTACNQYFWYGTTYTESGTYEKTLTNGNGCSYKRRLNLTVYYSDTTHLDSTCCQNSLPLNWNGRVFYSAGTQSRTFSTTHGCDSVVVMTVHVNNISFSSFDTTVCGQFAWEGSVYTHSGAFMKTFPNALGCDSMVIAHVTVMQPPFIAFDTVVCTGDLPVTWRGHFFENADTLTFTYVSALGCDSTVTFALRVAHPDTVTQFVSACDFFEWGGEVYDANDTLTAVFTNIHGCDSTVTIYLTVNTTPAAGHVEATICENELPYLWNGLTFTEAGSQTVTLPTVDGCDSVISLSLYVANSYHQSQTVTVCEDELPYLWNGLTFTEAGTQSVTLQTVDGCDSVISLSLYVANQYNQTQTDTICENELPYLWNGLTFTEPGTQSVTLQTVDGCDSVISLSLYVANQYNQTQTDTICENELPYLWNGLTFTEAGTQSVTLQTVDGCDSVISLSLYVANSYHQPQTDTICEDELPYLWNGLTFTEAGTQSVTYQTVDGCDSVISLSLYVANQYNQTQTVTICEDELPYLWNGLTFTEAGTQSITCQTVDGCDSVISLSLYVANNYYQTQTATICEDELPYLWNGLTFTEAGTQTVTLQTVDGCDSVISLSLYVANNYHQTQTVIICEDELPYTWNGLTFTEAGTQSVTLQTVDGCDSVISLSLYVANSYHQSQTVTICEDELPYLWNGLTFTEAGTQSVTFQTVAGCDSVISLSLYVANQYNQPQTLTICEDELPYHWNGLTFTEAGTQTVTLPTVDGCDSVISLSLYVANNYHQTQTDTICEDELPYIWNGLTFTEAGTQTVTLPTVDGCDSVISLSLYVANNYHQTQTDTICEDELPYLWNGLTFTEAGTQTVTLPTVDGCDSVISLSLYVANNYHQTQTATICEDELPYLWNGLTFTEAGTQSMTLPTVDGCDSTVTFQLTVIDTALEIISLTEDFCESMSMELAAVTAMTNYLWSTGEELPNITVTQPGLYSVTASQGSCRATAKYAVAACDFHLWLPNAITPSKNDGLNDVFCLPLRAQSMINDFEISIFDRWGEQVFHSTDKAFQWNGSVNGKMAVNAVYNYVIRYTLVGGKPSRAQGSVTVL